VGHRRADRPSVRLAREQEFSTAAESDLLDFVRVCQPRRDGFACLQVPDPSGRITGTRCHQSGVRAEREVEHLTAVEPAARGLGTLDQSGRMAERVYIYAAGIGVGPERLA